MGKTGSNGSGESGDHKLHIFFKIFYLVMQNKFFTHLPAIILAGCMVKTWRMLDLYWAQSQLW
jgi:uncharacterized paraquat-inducible protein A